ncbi:MAG: hypothetical protein ACRDSR_24235 [Pseudonocardiaceae bacterium]
MRHDRLPAAVAPARAPTPPRRSGTLQHEVLRLQQTAGNRATAHLLGVVQRAIDAGTQKDTRVIVSNPDDPFYLAVGSVTDPYTATHIRVRFDLKPNKIYEVPVTDLDAYHASTKFYDNLQMDQTRTINGVPSLVQFFREHETQNGKWALTGSAALACWAHHYEVPFRHPGDIDVVVANLNAWHYDVKLAVTGRPGEPTMTANHRTIQLGMFQLDLLANGGGLGEFGDGVWTVDGVPVVGLDIIEKYKLIRGSAQDAKDIEVVRQISAKRQH